MARSSSEVCLSLHRWAMWRQRALGATCRGNAPRQHTLRQGRLAALGRERCRYFYAACRPRALSHGQQGISATYFIVKIQRCLLRKAKGNEMFCLGDLRYSLSSLYSLSPDSLPKPVLCMVLSNKGLVSVQHKHV